LAAAGAAIRINNITHKILIQLAFTTLKNTF
jgi:hypothetical protein